MENIVIVGASGFAKEIKWIIDRINQIELKYNFIGYIDKEKSENIVGDDNYIINYPDRLAVVVAIANPAIRKDVIEKYKYNKNLYFPNLIDPSVMMSDSVVMGEGNIICAGCILTVDISITDFCIINLDCTVGHGSVIGKFSTINPSVNISGDVSMANEVSIGTGAQILQGLNIGSGTIVGAGAVVNKDLPPKCVAVGVPAKIIKEVQ